MADYGYIANPQVPDSFQTIGKMMGIANQAQALRSGALDIQQKQETMQPNIERVKAESRVAQETAQPKIEQSQAESKAAVFRLSGEQSQ